MQKLCFLSVLFFVTVLDADGQDTLFYQTGEVKGIGLLEGEKRHGRWEFYFPDGTLNSIFYYQNGVLDGEQLNFDEFGRLAVKEKWVKGLREDTAFSYHPSGQIRSIGFYEDGVYAKSWTYYYESGLPERIGYYKDGLPDSVWTFYHENGKIWQKGTYKLGETEGFWEFFDEDGDKTYEGTFSKGEKVGQWYRFTKSGERKEWKEFD